MKLLLGLTIAIFIIFFLYPYLQNIYIHIKLYFAFRKLKNKAENPVVKEAMQELMNMSKELIKTEQI